jgi:hypothetical protein
LTMRTKAFSKRRDNPHTSGGDIPEDFTDYSLVRFFFQVSRSGSTLGFKFVIIFFLIK